MAKQINFDPAEGLQICDLLQQFPKPVLGQKAKALGLRGYSAKKVGELRELIAERMLEAEPLQRVFCLFTDEQMRLFERAKEEADGLCLTDAEADDACGVTESGYALLDADNRLRIPADAALAYDAMNTPEFQTMRREYVWLMDCLDACEAIYGVMPEEQLVRVYNERKGYRKTLSELKAMKDTLDESLSGMRFENGKIIASSVYEDYRDIERMQGGGSFYLPSVSEILDLSRNFFPSEEEACKRMIRLLQTECDKERDAAYDIVNDIWEQFSKSYQVTDILSSLDLYEITFHSTQGMDEFTRALVDLNRHTRMMIYRGFTPLEIAEREVETKKTQVKKQKKIYPNDPCPCGSGKKYKHCHGRIGAGNP